jgi:hypothetical protein
MGVELGGWGWASSRNQSESWRNSSLNSLGYSWWALYNLVFNAGLVENPPAGVTVAQLGEYIGNYFYGIRLHELYIILPIPFLHMR